MTAHVMARRAAKRQKRPSFCARRKESTYCVIFVRSKKKSARSKKTRSLYTDDVLHGRMAWAYWSRKKKCGYPPRVYRRELGLDNSVFRLASASKAHYTGRKKAGCRLQYLIFQEILCQEFCSCRSVSCSAVFSRHVSRVPRRNNKK